MKTKQLGMEVDSALGVKLVCFDLGGVVVRLKSGVSAELANLCPPHAQTKLKALLKDDFVHAQEDFSLNERYQLGHISTSDYIAQILPLFEGNISEAELRTKALSVIAGEYEEVVALIERLTSKYRVGCYSNTHDLHWAHMLERFEWFGHFELKLASHLVGVAKPHPDSFHSICAAAALEPRECLFIDDRLANIEGAQRIGMQAVLCVNPADLPLKLRTLGVY